MEGKSIKTVRDVPKVTGSMYETIKANSNAVSTLVVSGNISPERCALSNARPTRVLAIINPAPHHNPTARHPVLGPEAHNVQSKSKKRLMVWWLKGKAVA
jgi:hypothetical protein